MKQFIKSYHVFLPYTWEKWLLYLVYPVLSVVLLGGLGRLTNFPPLGMMYCSALIVGVELYFDLLVFGGVGSKESNKLEYLKTSTKGMAVLRNGLIGDAIRRFFSVSIIVALTACLMGSREIKTADYVTCVLANLFLIELVLLLERSITSMGVINCINMLASALSLIFAMVLFLMGGPFLFLCLALYAVVVVVSRVVIMRKARRGYYDGTN